MVASSGVNTRRRYFCVMTNNEIELLILAGLLVLLVALGAALARRKKSDPKMAFFLALLQDFPAGGEETRESDESGDAHDTTDPEPTPGPRISDFFA